MAVWNPHAGVLANPRGRPPRQPEASPSPPESRRDSATFDSCSSTDSTLKQRRLSRLSSNTKCALSLNQIDHIDINSCYEDEHGVLLYVLDVYLQYYQTGIPSVLKSAEFFDELAPRKSITETSGDPSITTPRQSIKPPLPQYQIAHRYSAFRVLRKHLRKTVEESDDNWQHVKWCCYCSRIQYFTAFGSFPSRHPIASAVANAGHWQQPLVRLTHRRQKLAKFINRVVTLAKDASYRYQSSQCCYYYATVSSIVTEFLAAAEPQVRGALVSTSSAQSLIM
ncbi:hypothetical protein FI667_g3495, partial [Globisporangium splendens]